MRGVAAAKWTSKHGDESEQWWGFTEQIKRRRINLKAAVPCSAVFIFSIPVYNTRERGTRKHNPSLRVWVGVCVFALKAIIISQLIIANNLLCYFEAPPFRKYALEPAWANDGPGAICGPLSFLVLATKLEENDSNIIIFSVF